MKFEKSKLSDLCAVITDGSHTSPKATGDGYKMLSVKDMEYLDFNYDNAKLVSRLDYDNLVKNGCKPLKNDVLIAKDGNSCLENCFVMRQEKEVVLLSSIAILRPNLEKINPFYLMYILKSPSIKNDLKKNHVSGSAIPRMILKDFREYKISYPNLEYQNKIVDFLYSIDLKIEINKKTIKKLEELTFHIFKHWFIDFEFPNEEGQPYKSSGGKMVESELGMIPKEFQVSTFESISEVMSGATPSRKKDEYFTDLGIPWITPKDLSLNKNLFIVRGQQDITKDGFENSSTKLVPKNSILFSSRAPIGYIAINTKEVTTNQGFKSFVPNNANYREYIYLILKNLTPEIEANASGSTFKEISGSALKKFKIIVPNDRTISEFASLISPIFEKIFVVESENKKLTQLRDILLPKLLSGEVEVPVKEPESV